MEREAFLDEACGDDRALRARLAGMLAADEADEGLLDTPPVALPEPGEDDDPMIGREVGGYRVLGRLAVGGMGVVYRAEQASPKREVALKIVRSAWTSPSLVRRFRHEARTLGLLQHRGIAQIYEAGTFDNQPFFAMELVRGVPLDEYARGLPLDAKLRLIARVCHAVEHAHQKGVVHRDLKPGNVLVTPEGRPKVLDFGVARVTNQDVQAATIRTTVGQVIGTVGYMSPEQASGNPDAVDTRSDVYALGVLLYELATGRPPYHTRGRSLPDALRAVREDEPAPLPELRGDVETICLKALEKEPDRRYQSASALAADIQRFLRDEPIEARPATTIYKLRKFARRNRAAVVGASGVVVVLIGGLAGISWQAVRATNQRNLARDAQAHAERALAEANAVNEFFADIFKGADPFQSGADVRVADLLDAAAAEVELMDDADAFVRSRLRNEIATGYLGLGMFDEAEHQWTHALETRERLLGSDHAETAMIVNNLAQLYSQTRDPDHDAEAMFRRALEIRRRDLGSEDRATLRTATNLGMTLTGTDEGLELLRHTLETQRRVLGDRDQDTLTTINDLAQAYRARGQLDRAEPLYREAFDGLRETYGEGRPQTQLARSNLASALRFMERYDEAEPLFLESIAGLEAIYGAGSRSAFITRHNLARMYTAQGRHADAVRVLGELVRDADATLEPGHPHRLVFARRLAEGALAAGDDARAEPLLADAYHRYAEHEGPGSPHALRLAALLTELCERVGRSEDAAGWHDRADVNAGG